MEKNIRKIVPAILGVGMAYVAAYLNVNGFSAELLWIGVLVCFIEATSD